MMPAISGKEYVSRMKALEPNVWINGERMTEAICDHSAYKGAVKTKAELYDLQQEDKLVERMTYKSPTSGERVGRSFLQPKTKEDLESRRAMIKTWATHTYGMMGRTPDYLNTVIMTLAASAQVVSEQDPRFSNNLLHLYERAREYDLSFTHSFINPKSQRTSLKAESLNKPETKIVKQTADGVYLKGARLLATQGGMTDEILLLPPSGKIYDEENAFCLSIPSNAKGVTFVCRESYFNGESTFNYPLSSRFNEMDTMLIFNNVFVPWEHVYFHHRSDLAHKLFSRSSFTPLTLHQVSIRQITKLEFVLGLSQLLVKSMALSDYHHIHQKISEIIIGLETMKALLDRAEVLAREDEWGTMVPHVHSLFVAVNSFSSLYPRSIEILQLLGAGGLVAIPSEEDFHSSLQDDLSMYYQGIDCDSVTRAKLFRVVYDLTMSRFGTRQTQYERYFFGDPMRLVTTLYHGYPRDEYMEQVQQLID
ncbi:4-hydroxyphenylacetate 3-hydroxylase family protein [Bacillus weihaiensis]|nr:4-hydroxyphenylacetate 3-hydroxylase N-terminal domain-containing protein [Bacillus weihaiensis]